MASRLLRPAIDLMSQYAQYHRDKRNIVTHAVGIPLIVLAVGVLLSKPHIGGYSLAWIGWMVAALWYVTRGNLVLGVATCIATAALVAIGQPFGRLGVGHWLAWGCGMFVVGSMLQLLGHYYEGRRPAFVDDLLGLLVGPMFIVAEGLFALGWGRDVLEEIERRAGPTHLRDLAASTTR